ncbi:hypothetical protein BaRGS_00012677 [Batillaria attramentaria]|uniref:Uncharacterized protein n=1 Tax=Batillaria attramentaria TaxID=370345 RepID=A0ABD0L9J8_9CAEN
MYTISSTLAACAAGTDGVTTDSDGDSGLQAGLLQFTVTAVTTNRPARSSPPINRVDTPARFTEYGISQSSVISFPQFQVGKQKLCRKPSRLKMYGT